MTTSKRKKIRKRKDWHIKSRGNRIKQDKGLANIPETGKECLEGQKKEDLSSGENNFDMAVKHDNNGGSNVKGMDIGINYFRKHYCNRCVSNKDNCKFKEVNVSRCANIEKLRALNKIYDQLLDLKD